LANVITELNLNITEARFLREIASTHTLTICLYDFIIR